MTGGANLRGVNGLYATDSINLGSFSFTPAVAASGSTPATGPIWSGQGVAHSWNVINGGDASEENVNVDPTDGNGGFVWYNDHQGSALDVTKSLLTLKEQAATFGEVVQATGATFSGDVTAQNGATYWVNPVTVANNLIFGWQAIDSYTMGLRSNIGATVSLRISGDLQSTAGTGSNDPGGLEDSTQTVAGLHPDGQGGWQVTSSSTTTGGTVAMAGYKLVSLPTSNVPNGAEAFCTDCTLNSVTGVYAVYHTSDSKWHDFMNGTLAN